jgi:hypothetical protein
MRRDATRLLADIEISGHTPHRRISNPGLGDIDARSGIKRSAIPEADVYVADTRPEPTAGVPLVRVGVIGGLVSVVDHHLSAAPRSPAL